jgi:hypothetical protein
MPIKKTPRAVIEVLDAEGKVSGFEIENFYTFEFEEGDDPITAKTFTPRVIRDEATEEEVDVLLGVASEKMSDAHKSLNLQVADMQSVIDQVNAELRNAEALRDNALNKLAQVKELLK